MGLSGTVFETNGDFCRKSQFFPPRVSSLKGFPGNWISALAIKETRITELAGRERSLTVSSAVWMQCCYEMLSASRQQPHLLHVSAVDRRQIWSMDKSWRCVTLSGFLQSYSLLSMKPHFLWHALQWPWPVRKRVSSDHWRRWRSKPGSRIVGSTTEVELTTVADCQSSLHRLVTSVDCKSLPTEQCTCVTGRWWWWSEMRRQQLIVREVTSSLCYCFRRRLNLMW